MFYSSKKDTKDPKHGLNLARLQNNQVIGEIQDKPSTGVDNLSSWSGLKDVYSWMSSAYKLQELPEKVWMILASKNV